MNRSEAGVRPRRYSHSQNGSPRAVLRVTRLSPEFLHVVTLNLHEALEGDVERHETRAGAVRLRAPAGHLHRARVVVLAPELQRAAKEHLRLGGGDGGEVSVNALGGGFAASGDGGPAEVPPRAVSGEEPPKDS